MYNEMNGTHLNRKDVAVTASIALNKMRAAFADMQEEVDDYMEPR